jgi:hypothetical protein
MEPIRFVPLYYVAMLKSMIIVTKAPFLSTPIRIIVGIKYKPQTPRGTKLVSLHKDILREVNIIFANHPSNLAKGDSDPLGPLEPLGYFELQMKNQGKPQLPPNRPCRQPFNYFEYIKDSDLDVHVRVFKVAIRADNEIDNVQIVICSVLPLEMLSLIGVIITWEIT